MEKMSTEYEKAARETYKKVPIHELINFDKKPKNPVEVSIVIPVCNVEVYLRECLDSAIKQTLKDIEIICVNDGSTDNSLTILKDFARKDNRIKIISKDNAGYGHTMNIGMDMAQGEYIAILESDDFVDLHMYEDLYKLATEKKLDWIKSDFNRFVVESGEIKKTYIDVARRAKDLYNKVISPKEDKRAFSLVMQTWSGIYKRTFLIENNIRHNETPGASYQDNGFWFQTMMYASRAFFYNKPYYMNRRDNPNSSVHNKEKVYCMNVEYDYIRNILEKDKALFLQYIFQYSYKKFLNYIFTYNRIGNEYKWEFLIRFQKELIEADNKGEIDWQLYKEEEKKELLLVLNHPEEFFSLKREEKIKREAEKEKKKELDIAKKENTQVKNEILKMEEQCKDKQRYIYKLWNSRSFKLGKTLIGIPRKIKDCYLRKQRDTENNNENKKVHIVCITDENYSMPTTVSITSMKLNKKESSIYTIHILANNISSDSENKFLSLSDENFTIDLIKVEQDERFKTFKKGDGDLHVSPAAILKFKIPQILNNVGKVLYLDGDTIIQGDLRDLYNTNITGKYAAVVKDILSERNPKHLKFLKYKNKFYFNSGMMLLNLTKIRKENITEKLIDYRLHGINHFMDQDALNVVFKENVVYVSPRYNFLNKFYDWWDGERLSVFYMENMADRAKTAYKEAVILHLGSHEKPWIYDMGYLTRLYKKYYKRSPYRNIRLEVKSIEG